MRTEIVCIGSELLLGTQNTNGPFIAEKLATIGIRASRNISVGDEKKELENVLAESINRSELVIITGGLGPTFDDITREAVSRVLGKKLLFDKEAMSQIAAYFAKLNKKMPGVNDRQAYIIEGAKTIENTAGTAPGQMINFKGKLIFLLPGPPREIKLMMEKSVMPYLKKNRGQGILKIKTLRVAGMSESLVEEKIKSIVELERKLEAGSIEFAILAHQAGIDLKIKAQGTDEMLLDQTVSNIKKEFYGALGENIYGEDNQTLESVVGEMLSRKRKTLALAESCTGGLVASRITNISGSSGYFLEGAVTYSNESKMRALGVSENTLSQFGAVSEETALEIAAGIKKISGADFGLSTTGIAGPQPSSSGKPVGLVYIALVSDGKQKALQFNFAGSRTEFKNRISTAALDMLRREMLL